MVQIAISVEAFEAIARTLAVGGSVGFENKLNERGPGESYSDVTPKDCGVNRVPDRAHVIAELLINTIDMVFSMLGSIQAVKRAKSTE
jgi:hypothetical protein